MQSLDPEETPVNADNAADEPAVTGDPAAVEKVELPSSMISAWMRDLLFSVAVSFLIITFLYQPVRVEGTSMMPELRDQERLFINKFAYHFEQVKHDDVVVFRYPHDQNKSYIKRVIAGPGDTVRIDSGQVFVNNQPVAEPYVPVRYRDERSYPETKLAASEYFVLGDHRSISSDSRDFGPVDRSLIYGKAVFVYWPVNKIGVVR